MKNLMLGVYLSKRLIADSNPTKRLAFYNKQKLPDGTLELIQKPQIILKEQT